MISLMCTLVKFCAGAVVNVCVCPFVFVCLCVLCAGLFVNRLVV